MKKLSELKSVSSDRITEVATKVDQGDRLVPASGVIASGNGKKAVGGKRPTLM